MTHKPLVITTRKDPKARAELDALVLKAQARRVTATAPLPITATAENSVQQAKQKPA